MIARWNCWSRSFILSKQVTKVSPKNKQISSNWDGMERLRYSMMVTSNGTVTRANLKCLYQYTCGMFPIYILLNGEFDCNWNRWNVEKPLAVYDCQPFEWEYNYWSIKQSLGAVHFRCLTNRHKTLWLRFFSCWTERSTSDAIQSETNTRIAYHYHGI